MTMMATVRASIHCSIHGDTHVLMSDGTSKYQHHSGGLFRVFATAVSNKQLEVQCDFTDRTANMAGTVGTSAVNGVPLTTSSNMFIDPEMSSCRLKVYDVNEGCGVDVRHGGLQQSGMGWVAGKQMPLSSMGQVPINVALGVHIIPLTNNALSIEVNWNGTFIQVVMAERSVQIHGPSIGACVGLCGTCSGLQMPPTKVAAITQFVSAFAVPAAQAIQPQQICNANPNVVQSGLFGTAMNNGFGNGVAPQLFMQQPMATMYPAPQYSPPTMLDTLYTTSFESQAVAQLALQQCSDNDVTRLRLDPVFNSFVEDCLYDKSLGPNYLKAAKSSMDAFVTWTESLHRMNRVQRALLVNPFATVCASCIPVQWTDPVHTTNALMPAVTMTPQNKLQLQNQFVWPSRYNGQNTYALNAVIQALGGSSFSSPQWNSNIVLPSLSSLNLQPLPFQLLTSTITINDGLQSSNMANAGLANNVMQQMQQQQQLGNNFAGIQGNNFAGIQGNNFAGVQGNVLGNMMGNTQQPNSPLNMQQPFASSTGMQQPLAGMQQMQTPLMGQQQQPNTPLNQQQQFGNGIQQYPNQQLMQPQF
jgi:hypothetical protein